MKKYIYKFGLVVIITGLFTTSCEKQLEILAELMRLRRAACHPHLVDEKAGFVESSKEKLFGEIVDELLENGHKALVFSQFDASHHFFKMRFGNHRAQIGSRVERVADFQRLCFF